MVNLNYLNFTLIVVQKALQVTNGLKFMEIIESIKKNIKSLKQSNTGRKIYENLMMNYGEYFNVNKQKVKKNSITNRKTNNLVVRKEKESATANNTSNSTTTTQK